ncbi:hypothetical protein A3K86_14355 [Photobacterium jeanii]|uniref:DUF4154 domain-containing protein n=2 Tax=Photobacterium jeanii TaxID=858640 RepID=A0A178K8R2_9GAMM|nr:hypothetical protein A3K86_14355 [Photobacterium jeanii]
MMLSICKKLRSYYGATLRLPLQLMLFFSSSFLFNADSRAETDTGFDDHQIKAVYIYRFASFVRWPQTEDHQIQYCSLGADHISQTLHQLILDENNNKRLVFHYIDNLSQASQCEVVYISPNQFPMSHDVPQLPGVLTISGYPDFLKHGGMIELRSKQKRIRPIIALNLIQKANMAISSQLLRIAIIENNLTSTHGRKNRPHDPFPIQRGNYATLGQ